MGANSGIEWTDHTFNPWVGCTKVSPACDHCYAEAWARRSGQCHLWDGERRRTTASNWHQPIKWNREAEASGVRRKVFCASLADVFDNRASDRWRRDLWHLIEQTPALDWLLLTKRPQNIRKMLPDESLGTSTWGDGWANVWLGTTVCNQAEADRNIPHLLAVPAAMRFLSIEPLLGPLSFRWAPWVNQQEMWARHRCLSHLDGLRGIDWVIVGGESGPGARPTGLGDVRALRDQCIEACVPFFFKQWGEHDDQGRRVGRKNAGAMLDGREWKQCPLARLGGAL